MQINTGLAVTSPSSRATPSARAQVAEPATTARDSSSVRPGDLMQRLESRSSDFGSHREALNEVPVQNRSAIGHYLQNGPSISEQLGVELAGVDIFA